MIVNNYLDIDALLWQWHTPQSKTKGGPRALEEPQVSRKKIQQKSKAFQEVLFIP